MNNYIYTEFIILKSHLLSNVIISQVHSLIHNPLSDAASGWAGWVLAHPEFGSSVNPITTRGADCAHHITASPPGFENPAASLPHLKSIW